MIENGVVASDLRLAPGHRDYPLQIGQMLYHGAQYERRVLHPCAFLTPSTATAKQFAGEKVRDKRGPYKQTVPPGYISRYVVARLPRLMFLSNKAYPLLARELAKHGVARLHRMTDDWTRPKRARRRYGLWLSEMAVAWCKLRPSSVDGWVSPYTPHRLEFMLTRPMEFLRFWGSTPVSESEYENARGPDLPWGLSPRELAREREMIAKARARRRARRGLDGLDLTEPERSEEDVEEGESPDLYGNTLILGGDRFIEFDDEG